MYETIHALVSYTTKMLCANTGSIYFWLLFNGILHSVVFKSIFFNGFVIFYFIYIFSSTRSPKVTKKIAKKSNETLGLNVRTLICATKIHKDFSVRNPGIVTCGLSIWYFHVFGESFFGFFVALNRIRYTILWQMYQNVENWISSNVMLFFVAITICCVVWLRWLYLFSIPLELSAIIHNIVSLYDLVGFRRLRPIRNTQCIDTFHLLFNEIRSFCAASSILCTFEGGLINPISSFIWDSCVLTKLTDWNYVWILKSWYIGK